MENNVINNNEETKEEIKIKIFWIIFGIAIIVIIIALLTQLPSGAINSSPHEQIVGHWELIDIYGPPALDHTTPNKNIYFYEGGQMTTNGENMTYSVNETTLTISSLLATDDYQCTIDGNTMELSFDAFDDGETTVCVYERID